jgi:hypothetical protein
LEVIDDYNISIDASFENVDLLCIGKEINDFNTLDKNAIFTYNLSATQELSRICKRQQVIIDNLLLRIQAIEDK